MRGAGEEVHGGSYCIKMRSLGHRASCEVTEVTDGTEVSEVMLLYFGHVCPFGTLGPLLLCYNRPHARQSLFGFRHAGGQ